MTQSPIQNHLATKDKLHGLDHLRAFAITIVFLFHYSGMFPHPEWMNEFFRFGWTGVDLFFVLSGYLIAAQLFRDIAFGKIISFRTFFLKRFFRIVPAYWIVVAIYFYFPFVREREALAPLWKYLTFTQNLRLDLRTQGTFSHAWSLCIEEQFYLVLPITLTLLTTLKVFRKSAWLLLVVFLFGLIARYYSYNHFVAPYEDDDSVVIYWYKTIYYSTYCRLDGLLAGVSIAAMAQFRPAFTRRIIQHGNLLFLLSLCTLIGAYFLCLEQESFIASVWGFPLIAFGYGVMVLAAISPYCFLYKFSSKITATIATLSYALYLTHKMVIHVAQNQFEKGSIAKDSNGMLLLCTLTCLAGSFLLNKSVEKPFLKLRNKLIGTH